MIQERIDPTTFISVIIPVYGVEKYIERCARSLFEQTLKDGIEYIFVNDCTPDKSIEILEAVLEEYPERKGQVKIIHHKKNEGVGKGRLTGLLNSKGEYIIYCDPDDWVSLEMYDTILDKAKEINADIVICNIVRHYSTKDIIEKITIGKNKKDILMSIIKGEIHNSLCNKLIKKDLYDKIDKPFEAGLNMLEDRNVLPRLAYYANSIEYIDKPLYYYNKENEESHTIKWKDQHIQNILQTIKNNEEFFKDKNIDISAIRTTGLFIILYHGNYKMYKQLWLELPEKINFKLFNSLKHKILSFFLLSKNRKIAFFPYFLKSLYLKN